MADALGRIDYGRGEGSLTIEFAMRGGDGQEWLLTAPGVEATARLDLTGTTGYRPWLMQYDGQAYRAMTLIEAGRIIWAVRSSRPIGEEERG